MFEGHIVLGIVLGMIGGLVSYIFLETRLSASTGIRSYEFGIVIALIIFILVQVLIPAKFFNT